MKYYHIFPRALGLEPHYQIVVSYTQYSHPKCLTPLSVEVQSEYATAQSAWAGLYDRISDIDIGSSKKFIQYENIPRTYKSVPVM